ncbi:MAG: hypothetical protein HQL94_11650 [Magnetococcales bacterium]|nr:hypothetical protein [Magnetococcales bacterium]
MFMEWMEWPWLNMILILLTLISFGYALYVKYKRSIFTREHFAFAALAAQTTITILAIHTITSNNPFEAISYFVSQWAHIPHPNPVMGSSDKVLVLLFAAFFIWVSKKMFLSWEGSKSTQQKHNELLHNSPSLAMEGIDELTRLLKRKPPREIYLFTQKKT